MLYDSFSYEIPITVNSIQTQNRLVVARGQGWEGMGSYCLMDTWAPFGVMNMFWI